MTLAIGEIWSFCNDCGHETLHDLAGNTSRRRTYQEGPHSVDVGSTWEMLQCCGCKEVALRRFDWCSEDDPNERPSPIAYYPPRVARRKPLWAARKELPPDYAGLLNEVYLALHADSRRLAMMGARTLIDVFIRRTVGDKGSFANGLKALVAEGRLTQQSANTIEAAINAGSASSHRSYLPDPIAMNTVIDIVENLIHNEMLDLDSIHLRAATPPRTSR